MRKLLPGLAFLVAVATTASSCCKTKSCRPFQQFHLDLYRFSESDMNLVIVKTYEKGQGFARSARVDSLALKKGVNADVQERLDGVNRLFTITTRNNSLSFQSKYDYVVELPSAARVWQIDQLEDVPEEQEFCKPSMAKDYCMNSQFRTYRINGMLSVTSGVLPPLSP